MITRDALLAGVIAGVIYGLLYLAYGITQGWDTLWPIAVIFGLGVIIGAAIATDVFLRILADDGASKEV